MELGEYISLYRKEANITIDELADRSGVPKGTINKIIAGTTKSPTLENVKSIARALGKKLDDFGDSDFPATSQSSFTAYELDIIKKYRTLDEHGKKIVELVLVEESERMKNIPRILPPMERIISLDDYMTPVSAGTGEIALEDSPKEQIKVIDNAYTRKANFVVRVKGDSMMPRYFDGDKLLIQSAGIPNFGEIGIWCVDGQTYVKQAGNGELLSLNSNYDPIRLRGKEYRCEGKVIGTLDPAWIRK